MGGQPVDLAVLFMNNIQAEIGIESAASKFNKEKNIHVGAIGQ
jgi:hypothetical protein